MSKSILESYENLLKHLPNKKELDKDKQVVYNTLVVSTKHTVGAAKQVPAILKRDVYE